MTTLEAPRMTDNGTVTTAQFALLETRLRTQEVAAARAEAADEVRWVEQRKQNEVCVEDRRNLREHIDGKFAVVFKKLTSLEVKVAGYAAGGTILATVALKYLFP